MDRTLKSTVGLYFTFLIFLPGDIDDLCRYTVIDFASWRNDLLQTDFHVGPSKEMPCAIRHDDPAHDTRAARDQHGAAPAGCPDIFCEREQDRVILLKLGRVQSFIQNDGQNRSFGDHHLRGVGSSHHKCDETSEQHGTSFLSATAATSAGKWAIVVVVILPSVMRIENH